MTYWIGTRFEDDGPQDNRMNFMTTEEIFMVDDFLSKITQNRGYMEDTYNRWEKEQEAYSGDQVLIQNRPNSRINIINANVEGQVAALVEQDLAVTCHGVGPSDKLFAPWANISLNWTLSRNRIRRILERHERRRELFGCAWLKVYWDDDAADGFGLARITCTPLNSIFVDMKITDPVYLEESEYIAEVMPKSKTWAIEKFGPRGENINYGGSDRASIFTKMNTTDDEDIFWYIQLWTKTDGKLRMLEFSDDGILLNDSFKDWDGEGFTEKKDPEAFYRVNKYPYFLTNLYYDEGELYGFGDGKLLRPLQDMLNDLYDQIRRAARPNRIFFDPTSEVEIEDIDEDDGPVPCIGPNTTIRVVKAGDVNAALFQLVNNIHDEVQRVTRFGEIMTGQRPKRITTATEATVQQQQGNACTDHKKMILEETLQDVCEYILGLMMEKYTTGKAFRVSDDKDDYTWVDFPQMNEVPVLVPPNDAYVKDFKEQNPGKEVPKWMQLPDDGKGKKGLTKSVELDIEINIGAGLPKNKAFLFQMVQQLSKVVIDGKAVVSWDEFRKFIKDYLGLPLDEAQQTQLGQTPPAPPGQPAQGGQQPPAPNNQEMPNANIPGLTSGGAPQLSLLPSQPGQQGGGL